jgi:hypothetical protein
LWFARIIDDVQSIAQDQRVCAAIVHTGRQGEADDVCKVCGDRGCLGSRAAIGGAVRTVAQLTAGLSLPERQLGPLPVTLAPDGGGHYIGTAAIPLAGAWKLALTVRTDDVDETTVTVPVLVR